MEHAVSINNKVTNQNHYNCDPTSPHNFLQQYIKMREISALSSSNDWRQPEPILETTVICKYEVQWFTREHAPFSQLTDSIFLVRHPVVIRKTDK
jgi:hypothetical protein